MSAIFDNINSLDINWHPGCTWHLETSTYTYGPIGRIGPGTTDAMIDEQIRNHKKLPVPSSLVLYIKLKEGSDPSLFVAIDEELKSMNNDIKIINVYPMRLIKEWKVKEEFVELEKNIKAEINEKNIKIREHINALKALGVDVDEIEMSSHIIHDDHRESLKEYYDVTSGAFHVCCRKGTALYEGLAERGILEAVYPEWYAEGKY